MLFMRYKMGKYIVYNNLMIIYFVKTIFIRSYKYLLLTFFSLLIGAFLFGTIVSLTSSLSSYVKEQGKSIIGGDIVLNSARPIDTTDPIFLDLVNKGHTLSSELSLQAVFRNPAGTSSVAASIRAVEPAYPLYGKILLKDGATFKIGNNQLYAEQVFLDKLNISVGQKVNLGSTTYTVAGVILKEPDGVSVGISFTPKVILAKADILLSTIDLSKSRVSNKVFIKQSTENNLTENDISQVSTFAKSNKIRFDDAKDGPNNLVSGLSSVKDFTGIVIAIALFLVAINIGANLTYILSKFKKTIALLKTFGATTRQIQSVYSLILGGVGLVAGAAGASLGAWFSNLLLLPTFSKYVSEVIPVSNVVPILILGGISGLILIIISSVPFFNSLNLISPKELLLSISTRSSSTTLKRIVSYTPLPLFLALLLYIISGNIMLSVYSVFTLLLLFLIFSAITFVLISYLYTIRKRFSFMFSSILSFMKWRGLETVITSASIMTALAGVFIVSAVEQNILFNLQSNISKSAPALYLVDISSSQLSTVKKIAGPTFTEYPVIRGRLLGVNDRDMTNSTDGDISREFNMTYRSTLIEGETIVSGIWHGDKKTLNAASIDKSFGDRIGGVTIGDTITLFIQGITITANVASIHEANRSNGTPFFYMVFSPDVLSTFPASYFGTAEGNDVEVTRIESSIGEKYPNIIPIRTSKILDTVNQILTNVILLVKIIGIPSIVLGLMLVLVMTGQSLFERKSDVLVLRVFGLEQKRITFIFVAEVGALILVTTFISYFIAHLIAYLLNIFLFSFTLFAFAVMPLYISTGLLFVTIAFSFFITLSIIKSPLKKLLSEK